MYVTMGDYNIYKCMNFSIVTCDPPCVQGACVANNTCNCAEGYTGERCTEPGMHIVVLLAVKALVELTRCFCMKSLMILILLFVVRLYLYDVNIFLACICIAH